LCAKIETFVKFKIFKELMEGETREKIYSTLRIDHGGEFIPITFNDYCQIHIIKKQLTKH
jgi:hypothetical protein